MNKTPMRSLEADVRNKNFEEVAIGYSEEEALQEASRCINCKNRPCVSGCPVSVNIPEFIMHVKNKEYMKAYDIIKTTNALPAVCGRVCPQETQCEAKCVRGIKGEPVAIGRLERFVSDYALKANQESAANIKLNGIKAAIIGSGPAGLTCASELAKLGYSVTIFEAVHTTGGVLTYGIPEFRLPKAIVQKEIEALKKMGVDIQTNVVIGRTLNIEDLEDMGYKSIFVGTGAGLPVFMNIPGENLKGVYSANEYLTRINLMKAYRADYDTPIKVGNNIAIVGGGNVAMDAARCAKRLGYENVYIIYRRSFDEMPARLEEIHHAKEEGIIFKMLCAPIEIVGDDKSEVCGLKLVNMELGEADASGRRSPIVIEGSEHTIGMDAVIMAIGTSTNPIIKDTTKGLDTNKWNLITTDESGQTSLSNVFAGGDSVTGAATVILAMGAGRNCAKAMDEYMQSNK